MLFGGVDQRLVQIHHQDQFFVPVEPLLVLSAQLLCLLLKRMRANNEVNEILHLGRYNRRFNYLGNHVSNLQLLQFQQGYHDSFPIPYFSI